MHAPSNSRMIAPMAVEERWRAILRLRFRKGIPSHLDIHAKFCAFQLEIADEFDVAQDVVMQTDRLSVLLKMSDLSENKDANDYEIGPNIATRITCSLISGEKPGFMCRVNFLENNISLEKRYQLYICYDSCDSQLFILPLQSDFFHFTSSTAAQTTSSMPENSNKLKSSNVVSSILCTNYRTMIFVDSESSITCCIKEDYGATIGSHVYDCSIILSKYLMQTSGSILSIINVKNYDQIIELGAGCGLASIICGKISGKRVLATDRRGQLPLLQRNVNANQVQDCVQCLELDWESKKQIQTFFSVHLNITENNRRTLILAADVLYDRDAAKSLHVLLNQSHAHIKKTALQKEENLPALSFSTNSDSEDDNSTSTNICDILLVYKNRNNMTAMEVQERVVEWCGKDVAHSYNMSCSLLYSEAFVYIFSLLIE